MTDHIFMPLIEAAPHNFGKTKQYLGVMGNLVAFGCKLSFEKGFDGYLSFESKTKLIKHYEKVLGANILFGQRMEIDTNAAINLISRYYPDFFNKYIYRIMDIVEFFKDVEKNDMQYLLTDPHAKYTEKDQWITSAWIRASKSVWNKYGRSLTEDEKNQVIRDAGRAYDREHRQKRKDSLKHQTAGL
jgi:hypothetical protein